MDICFVPNPENVRASLSDASQEQYDFLLQNYVIVGGMISLVQMRILSTLKTC